MDREEFAQIRNYLNKTQDQMARLLGISPKAVQSFEQGWRRVPVHVERQIFFLLAMQQNQNTSSKPCWVIQKCPIEKRRNCPAWEFQSGDLCWFINGTICQGEVQASWHRKMAMCRQCKMFQSLLPPD